MSLPYTYMYVSGLKLGLTHEQLRTMPYNRLVYMLQAWTEANQPEEKDSVRQATQADMDAFFRS